MIAKTFGIAKTFSSYGRVGFLVGGLGRVVLVAAFPGCLSCYAVYGDAAGGGVVAEPGQGFDAGGGGAGGDAVLLQDRGDAADGEADVGLVGAEQLAEQPVGHAQALVAGGGGHEALEGKFSLGAAAGLASGGAAGQVQPLLAGRGERDGDGAQQGGEVRDAGERGQLLQDRAGRGPCGRLRLRPGGGGPDRGVPLAVERVAVQDAVLEVPHPLDADLEPVGGVRVVEDGGALQALVGGGRGDPGDGVLGGHQGPAAPGSGDVAEQPVLDLVPLRRPGREVADRDLQARLRREERELVLPRVVPAVIGAAGVAGEQQPPRPAIAGGALGPPPRPAAD